jgi:hypothetical protein
MTMQLEATRPTREPVTSRPSLRAAVTTGIVGASSGTVLWLVAATAGVDFEVTTGGATLTVTPVEIAATVAVATTVGGLVLAATRRRWPEAPQVLAWAGLAVGLLSAVSPLLAASSMAAGLALALMHLITGTAWWVAVRRTTGTP